MSGVSYKINVLRIPGAVAVLGVITLMVSCQARRTDGERQHAHSDEISVLEAIQSLEIAKDAGSQIEATKHLVRLTVGGPDPVRWRFQVIPFASDESIVNWGPISVVEDLSIVKWVIVNVGWDGPSHGRAIRVQPQSVEVTEVLRLGALRRWSGK